MKWHPIAEVFEGGSFGDGQNLLILPMRHVQGA
jgi:hypothetical protein